ncbi:hypothetical protein FJV41_11435 [Myxococcus llanfairpwllgwyngyllgogerychwyrndrobwllllantysiliogogogochensis]|uniref:Uncharacterized protein n=1 Tax=Myxococcus llanfairpwllgwyngyllgogerychwyrndrobwllllantysiliogogogochensis TaxID=2590453 RepID=A0A540X3N8_9BACT|nr:hypothetical protein [Myxococcus llanfairpwllgwyngyllgogerychwyrndrobwllllantysiliogogogochensis]TQF15855.1 hypothetical protein FJV41_11435 [Myxococcus llanfairpwllgwyngyllgogerychwyrndrobwllllantysiliogogogochensis]
MKRNVWTVGTLVLGLLLALPASAAKADRRQVRQQARIVQGVKSGELTGREAVRLQSQHRELRRDIHQARADDGRLDARERAGIRREQNQLNRRIHRQKHDGQSR